MKKIKFSENTDIDKHLSSKKTILFNFLNLNDIYAYRTTPEFFYAIGLVENKHYLDGFIPKVIISIKRKRKVLRVRGPTFTRELLKNSKKINDKKILFLGPEKDDISKLKIVFPHLKKKNIFVYNPPYIMEIVFPESEAKKIAKIIERNRIEYVFVCIASPKQNILSSQIVKHISPGKKFFNVGAALDFILEKKKEAPKIVQSIGIEWLYRLVTDFKYTKKKVWRHFKAIRHLNHIE
jgi:exopolysaccharide biosynthesis WecB/TagA/CpsF family protein